MIRCDNNVAYYMIHFNYMMHSVLQDILINSSQFMEYTAHVSVSIRIK